MKNVFVNKQDERYKKNDQEIRKVLLGALTNRSLNLRPKDVCKKATITRPTFYSHCEGVDDALKQYEEALTVDFTSRLLGSRKRGVVFTIMLGFINDEQDYFRATLSGSNNYLLNNMFGNIRVRLGHKNATDKCYEIYTQHQIALIYCWGKFEDFERQRIPFYANRLTATEIIDLGLEREQ